jgi:hypothetical protein
MIAVVGEHGEEITTFSVSNANDVRDLIAINDTDLLVMTMHNFTGEIFANYVDTAAHAIGESVNIPEELVDLNYTLFAGVGYDFYIKNYIGLYGYNIGGEAVQIINWLNSDIYGDYISSLIIVSPSEFLFVYCNWDDQTIMQ